MLVVAVLPDSEEAGTGATWGVVAAKGTSAGGTEGSTVGGTGASRPRTSMAGRSTAASDRRRRQAVEADSTGWSAAAGRLALPDMDSLASRFNPLYSVQVTGSSRNSVPQAVWIRCRESPCRGWTCRPGCGIVRPARSRRRTGGSATSIQAIAIRMPHAVNAAMGRG